MTKHKNTPPTETPITTEVPKKTEEKNIPTTKKKNHQTTIKIVAITSILCVASLYALSLSRLQSTEKFVYIDQLDGNSAQKNMTKLSLVHDFLWKEKKIATGFPLKAQAINDFSPIVTEKNESKRLEKTLAEFWENTKHLQDNATIYPEKIAFTVLKEHNKHQIFQRMVYWNEDKESYQSEINALYGQVITKNPAKGVSFPEQIKTLPIDQIIQNISEVGTKISGLEHIIMEYQAGSNSYNATFIDQHQNQQNFAVNENGVIKRKLSDKNLLKTR